MEFTDKKYYLVIYIPNEDINAIVDGIRILADPNQKHRSHITIRGPYFEKDNIPKEDSIKKWNAIIQNQEALVNSVGTFQGSKQFTLFFKADLKNIQQVWWKRDFKEVSPHITIINNSALIDFAKDIHAILSPKNIFFSFKVDKIDLLQTNGESEIAFTKLSNAYNYNWLSNFLNFPISQSSICKLTSNQRLELIDELSNHLVNQFHSKLNPSKIAL